MSSIVKSAVVAGVVAIVAANFLATHKNLSLGSIALPGKQSAPQAVQPSAPPRSGATAVLAQGRNGHYFAKVEARGLTLDMVVDTGASLVTLTAEDARKLGFYPGSSDFTVRMLTANGETRAAPVKLDMVRIDGVLVYDVDALVAQPGALNISLLGMSYLKKLASYQAEQGRLVLHQ